MLAGPFDSTYGYVSHVALPNCVDYFLASKRDLESGRPTAASQFERQRFLHNAAISVNSIIDWIQEDQRPGKDPSETRREIEKACPAMAEVAKIANAAKHRRRRKNVSRELRTDVPHADELVSKAFDIYISDEAIGIDIGIDVSSIERALAQAFRFWLGWQSSAR